MTAIELRAFYEAAVDMEDVTVKVIESDDIRQEDLFIQGWFTPNWNETGFETPIEISIIVSTEDADINMCLKKINNLFLKTVNHEYVHLAQFLEGRFNEDDVSANEAEAYRREGDFEFVNLI